MNAAPTVFVLDDEPSVCNGVAALASTMGLACHSFTSVERFLERFDPLQPGCAIIDMRIGDTDGIKLLRNIAGHDHDYPVILISAYLNVSTAVRAMQSGAFTVLEKPCPADQLDNAIREAVNASQTRQKTRLRRSELQARFNSLQPRERKMMMFIVNCVPNKNIIRELGVSMRTAARIRATVYEKMGVEFTVELAQIAVELSRFGLGE
jgi:two-component system, LuxR family, response regulator FixJ